MNQNKPLWLTATLSPPTVSKKFLFILNLAFGHVNQHKTIFN